MWKHEVQSFLSQIFHERPLLTWDDQGQTSLNTRGETAKTVQDSRVLVETPQTGRDEVMKSVLLVRREQGDRS